uniref:Uncharacterized protein n=1 Tax=Ditylenchus dipsaci TaxID=166011 RepID=A0A915CPK7_9BILA
MNSLESKSECLANGDEEDDDFQFSISDIKTPQPGSVVQCETKVATITGQVLQCENGLLVVLQSDSSRKQMRFINLLHVNNLTVIKEASPNFVFDLPGASWEEANKRLEKAERLKRSLCISADAPIEAIRTFGTLKSSTMKMLFGMAKS